VFTFDPNDPETMVVDNKVVESVNCVSWTLILLQGKPMPFEMDTIFTPASTQVDVFKQAEDLITSVTDGYNVCIFAYGQVWMSFVGLWGPESRRPAPARRSPWMETSSILVSTDALSFGSSRLLLCHRCPCLYARNRSARSARPTGASTLRSVCWRCAC
jgi:hypothetical protein